MAHAACAENYNVEIFIKALHRAADGFAKVVATIACGRRVLHHVDAKWDNKAGPFVINRFVAEHD